jgi:hypothetical protein
MVIPTTIRLVDFTSSLLLFDSASSGYAVATIGGDLPAISSSYAGYTLQVASSAPYSASWVAAANVAVTTAVSSSFAATASSADNLTVRGTLTAQTINVQTITSSIEFITGSTRNGSLAANTHQFTGSVLMSGSLNVGGVSTFSNYITAPYYLVTSNIPSSTASTGYLDYSGGGTRLFSVGTSGATKGTFRFIAKGADDSSIEPLGISATGAATFSSTVTTGDALSMGAGGGGGGVWTWGATEAYIYSPTSKNLNLTTDGGLVKGLRITTSGAATFSSTVTAGGQLITSAGQTGGYVAASSGYVNETQTISTNGTSYYLYKYTGTANGSSSTIFNITGMSTTNGTYADIYAVAQKDATASGINTNLEVQINGQYMVGIQAGGTSATTVRNAFRVCRMDGSWIIIGTVRS